MSRGYSNTEAFVIHPDGNVEGLYTDLVDLAALGRLAIRRASSVEWDEARQQWVAITPEGQVIAEGPNRAEVLEAEHDHFVERILRCGANC